MDQAGDNPGKVIWAEIPDRPESGVPQFGRYDVHEICSTSTGISSLRKECWKKTTIMYAESKIWKPVRNDATSYPCRLQRDTRRSSKKQIRCTVMDRSSPRTYVSDTAPNEKGLKIIIDDMFRVWGSVAVLFDPVKGLKTWQTVTASRCSVGQA